MDSSVVFLAILTATMLAAAFNPWRLGNEKRDAAILGAVDGICAASTALAAII